jgi:hypothetical protein
MMLPCSQSSAVTESRGRSHSMKAISERTMNCCFDSKCELRSTNTIELLSTPSTPSVSPEDSKP